MIWKINNVPEDVRPEIAADWAAEDWESIKEKFQRYGVFPRSFCEDCGAAILLKKWVEFALISEWKLIPLENEEKGK